MQDTQCNTSYPLECRRGDRAGDRLLWVVRFIPEAAALSGLADETGQPLRP